MKLKYNFHLFFFIKNCILPNSLLVFNDFFSQNKTSFWSKQRIRRQTFIKIKTKKKKTVGKE